jgi:hypothetical protein
MIRPLRGAVAGTVVLAGFAAPAVALGHSLTAVYRSPLPLAVYLVGAAVTVGLSFAFVLLRDVRADPPDPNAPAKLPPAWIRIGRVALGAGQGNGAGLRIPSSFEAQGASGGEAWALVSNRDTLDDNLRFVDVTNGAPALALYRIGTGGSLGDG